MAINTKDVKTDVLLNLLSEARTEADALREKLNKYKQTLLATRLIMGHEIKRPATAISGYLDLVLEDLEMWAGCDAVENVKRARGDCELLNELNSFYLELLKIENNEEHLNIQKIDLSHLVENVIDELPPENKARSRIKLDISDDVKTICFNANALKLVLVNSIENALKYSPINTEVSVTARPAVDKRGSASEELVNIQVADCGIGIPEEYLQKIFNPFVRVPAGKKEGTGLGLTLVRSLVELYGGNVSIKSKKDHGTVIYIMLPDLRKTNLEL
jgi:signal transduction histidine kinase